jgi:hypothetical protein
MVSAQVMTLTEGVLKVMLLSKLKASWAMGLVLLVGAGAVGLTYRPAAAQPKPGSAGPASPAARATADELEELRLEIAALRKGLEATRQQVKTLDRELQFFKQMHAAAADGKAPVTPDNALGALAKSQFNNYFYYAKTRIATDPLAEAQSALKRIRAKGNDQEALDALERALKQLTEREVKRRALQDSKDPEKPLKP